MTLELVLVRFGVTFLLAGVFALARLSVAVSAEFEFDALVKLTLFAISVFTSSRV
jgi:hypothetical protein